MAKAYVCICGPYRADQPRVSKLAAALAKKMPVTFVVASGKDKTVAAVGGRNKLAYVAKAAAFLRKNVVRGDIILGYGHAGALAAFLGSRGNGAKFWYDYPDPWSGWYHYRTPTDSLKWSIGRNVFSRLEKTLYNSAGLITAASFEQLRFLERQHGKRRCTSVILNCPDLKKFRRMSGKPLKTPKNQRVLLYLGSILEEYGCETLVKMMPLVLARQNALLLFLGSARKPEFLARLKAEAKRFGVEKNILFLPPVPSDQVPGYLSLADVGFVPFKDVFYNNVGSPNKLFEYMACGAVPIASDMKEFHHYVQAGQNGLFAKPGDARAFAGATLRLLGDRPLLEKMRGRNLALAKKEYNWVAQEKKLFEALKCLR